MVALDKTFLPVPAVNRPPAFLSDPEVVREEQREERELRLEDAEYREAYRPSSDGHDEF